MSKLRKSLVDFLYEAGGASGCHQMPERSFFYKGRPFPVCARCTGVAVGQIGALLAAPFLNLNAFIGTLLLVIMGTDWGLQEIKILPSTNRRRFITGILGGFGLFSLYILSVKKVIQYIGIKRRN